MLKIDNLQFIYTKDKKIYRYSLYAKEGEVVSIMGKSGSGKSTLLDILAGFLEPCGGSALYNEVNFLDKLPEKRPVSILFQDYNLFEYLNVEQNIGVGIDKSFKITKEKSVKIKKILNKVDLKGYEKREVSSLSGGEKQRVALSRVLLMNRPILLLDEPFGGLDKETKIEMLKLVKKITLEQKLITIMVTHDAFDVELIADKRYEILQKDGKKPENILKGIMC